MRKIAVTINDELAHKINLIAQKSGRSLDECVASAIRGYVDEYEDIYRTDLCAIDNIERSFFLSIGE
ncbi:MAG: hypothetical protein E7018_06905 [Alphaproteobacteria bacterium]|nr:hypothetical protein [Alphaproteobacteria bacterium]